MKVKNISAKALGLQVLVGDGKYAVSNLLPEETLEVEDGNVSALNFERLGFVKITKTAKKEEPVKEEAPEPVEAEGVSEEADKVTSEEAPKPKKTRKSTKE